MLRRSGQAAGEGQALPLLRVDDLAINRAALCVLVGDEPRDLTASELRLLAHLVERGGEVVEREFLYKQIFGHPAYPMDRSLDMLVSRVRKKLGARPDGTERIKAVRGEGYMYLLPGRKM